MRGGEVEKAALDANLPPELDVHLAYRQVGLDRAHVPHLERRDRHADRHNPTTPKSSSGKRTSEDVVGTAVLPVRGTLKAAVSSRGLVTLAYKGKSVREAEARQIVHGRRPELSNGFLVMKLGKKPMTVTGTSVRRQALGEAQPDRRHVVRDAGSRQVELHDPRRRAGSPARARRHVSSQGTEPKSPRPPEHDRDLLRAESTTRRGSPGTRRPFT